MLIAYDDAARAKAWELMTDAAKSFGNERFTLAQLIYAMDRKEFCSIYKGAPEGYSDYAPELILELLEKSCESEHRPGFIRSYDGNNEPWRAPKYRFTDRPPVKALGSLSKSPKYNPDDDLNHETKV